MLICCHITIHIDEQHSKCGEYNDEHTAVPTISTPPVDYASCRHVSVTLTERHTVWV